MDVSAWFALYRFDLGDRFPGSCVHSDTLHYFFMKCLGVIDTLSKALCRRRSPSLTPPPSLMQDGEPMRDPVIA